MRRLGYPPHVTLAICEDGTEQATLVEAVRRTATDWPRLNAACPALGAFSDPPIALFLIVTPTETLLRQQAALCQALPEDRLHPHYQPGIWLPHITAADDLQTARVSTAMAVAAANFQPFTACFTQLEVVRFRPVRVLWNAALKAPATPA